MMLRIVVAAAAMGCLPAQVQADPPAMDVQVNGGLVDVDAAAEPLRVVVDELARKAGIHLVYEGAPPAMLVTARLSGLPPSEALPRLFEGLDINYAMALDASRSGVEQLVIFAAVRAAAAGSPSTVANVMGLPQLPPGAEMIAEDPDVGSSPTDRDGGAASDGPLPTGGPVPAGIHQLSAAPDTTSPDWERRNGPFPGAVPLQAKPGEGPRQ